MYEKPGHPYTQSRCCRRCRCPTRVKERERKKSRIVLEGDVPSPANPPSGCRFRTRCWKAQDICAIEEPALIDRGAGHPVACHFPESKVDVVMTETTADRARGADTDDVAAVLAAKAAEIEAEIAAITVPMESPGSTVQFGKRAGDSTAAAAEQLSRVAAHEQMLAIAGRRRARARRSRRAPTARCDVCGGPVGDERLEALPWAVRCVVVRRAAPRAPPSLTPLLSSRADRALLGTTFVTHA